MPIGQADTIFIPACVSLVSKDGYSTKVSKDTPDSLQKYAGIMLSCPGRQPWMLRSTHAGQWEGLRSQLGGNPQSPGSSLSWATSLALNFRTLKVKEDDIPDST